MDPNYLYHPVFAHHIWFKILRSFVIGQYTGDNVATKYADVHTLAKASLLEVMPPAAGGSFSRPCRPSTAPPPPSSLSTPSSFTPQSDEAGAATLSVASPAPAVAAAATSVGRTPRPAVLAGSSPPSGSSLPSVEVAAAAAVAAEGESFTPRLVAWQREGA